MTFNKLLVPVDFSPPSHDALRTAARIAAESDGELEILHVWQVPIYAGTLETTIPRGVIDDVIAAAARLLAEWQREAEALGARRVTTALRNGVAWDEIVHALRRTPAFDLVVLATHGRTGIKHALLGSVAEKIVRHAPCAVLVVRPTASEA